MFRIAVFDVSPDERPYLIDGLGGADVELEIREARLSEQTAHLAKGCEGVSVLGWSRLDAALLGRLSQMGVRYVSTRTVGVDHIDVAAARALGIRVSHASYPPNAVADLTVLFILVLLRNYKRSIWKANVNDFSLSGLKGRALHELTVGVWGAGAIGRQVLRNLSGFGCRLLAVNKTSDEELDSLATIVTAEEMLREADIVSLHLPLTDQTSRLIDRGVLNAMKPGALLINTARAELMALEDVIEALESGQLGGLALDVFEGENGIYHQNHGVEILRNRDMAYLRQLSNVLMTPHMGFYTTESIASMVRTGIEGIVAMHRGSTPLEV